MAFLTGLAQQAQLNATKGALTAIGETESRHNTWALMDIWDVNSFAGSFDTSFPYANQILYSTNRSWQLPSREPAIPIPHARNCALHLQPQNQLPLTSGTEIEFVFTTAPTVWEDQPYHAVFFHELQNVSMCFDTKTNTTTIPDFDLNKALILGVIADEVGAPYKESVVAGPVLLVEQPAGAIKLA